MHYSIIHVFCSQVSRHSMHESHIIFLYWSPYPTSNTIRFGDLSPATLCVSSARVTRRLISANLLWESFFFNARMAQESMGMFTVAKIWLIFLDQIRKMTPRVLWLCRRAACPSSNETRRQRAWSASLNIDTEQRGTRATSRICFFKFKVHGYWKHYAVPFLSKIPRGYTSTLSTLKSNSANFIANTFKHSKTSSVLCILSHICCGLNSDGKRDGAAYLHFKASQRHTVH